MRQAKVCSFGFFWNILKNETRRPLVKVAECLTKLTLATAGTVRLLKFKIISEELMCGDGSRNVSVF